MRGRDVDSVVEILRENRVVKKAPLKGLKVSSFQLPRNVPAGYIGVLLELLESVNPPPPLAQPSVVGAEASLVQATAAGFDQFASALDKVLSKGKNELVVVDLSKALEKVETNLQTLSPAAVHLAR